MAIGNLLFAYNWNDTSGVDKSGNGRNFSFTGSTTRTAAGGGYTYGGARPNARALTQGSLEIQDGPAVTGLNPAQWTLACWAKMGIANPSWLWEWYWSANDTGVRGWLMLSSVLRGRIKNPSNSAFEVNATADATNWHFWAITHDGSTLRVYRDTGGTLAEVGNLAAAFTPPNATAIRVFDQAGNGTFLGDTRCWDSALTLSELQSFQNTPVDDGQTVSPTGIASAEAFGSPTVTTQITASPTGIPSGEQFGSPTITQTGPAQTVSPTGIPSAEAFGVPVVTATPPAQTVEPVGIPTSEQFGSPVVSTQVTVSPSGISSQEAVGNPTVSTSIVVHPTGIPSGEAFGQPTITGGSEETPIDIEVTIGPTRKRELATVGSTRQKWSVGDTRKGVQVGETRKDR